MMKTRRMEMFILFINILYVTANKATVYDQLIESLLKYWNTSDNESQCQFNVNDEKSGITSGEHRHQPLLIHTNSSKVFHPTEHTGIITMKRDEKLQVFCSTGFSRPKTISGNSVLVRCMNNGHIQSRDGHTFSFNNFSCRKHPIHSARRRVNMKCYNNSTFVDIGFEVLSKKFLITMTLCHNVESQQTYYAKYRLSPANVEAQHGIKRPSFIQSDFFPDKDVNLLYGREHQRKIISEFMGSDVISKMDASNGYLSRGHLAAKGDFIYGNEQRATFYYVNVAPQWQSFNGGNWRAIEDASRRLCAQRNITLNVYTGTHDVLTMINSKGLEQAIYLDMLNNQIPIPKLFYKILIDPLENSGIAIVCANNVYTTIDEIQEAYVICKDVSEKIKYIKWKRTEVKKGYCYACSVDDFLKTVPHLNGIQIKNLLI